MSGPTAVKVLRIGVFQGDRCVEERLLRKRVGVTIGQTLSNTFVIPTSTMPASYALLTLNPQGRYILHVNDRMGGRISLGGNEVIDLTRLRNVSAATKTAAGYDVELNDSGRGKVTIGETRLLFQFVTPPSASVGMLPTALGGGALAGFSTFLGPAILIFVAMSALFQIGPLFYVMLQDWPEPEGYEDLPDWYLDQEAEAIEEEEKKEEVEDEDENKDEEGLKDDTNTEVVEDVQVKPEKAAVEEKKDRAPKSAEQARAEKRMRKEQGKKIIGQVFGVDGGESSLGGAIAQDIVGADAHISALSGLNAEDIGGGGGGGPTSGLGLGGAGDATGEPSLKSVEGGGNKIIGSGPKTAETGERAKVELKIKEETKIPESVAKGDKIGLESVFKSKSKQIENCYKRIIQKYGDQSGKLVVKITIGTDGKVLSVNTSVDDVGKGLAECVEAKIKRWAFPKMGKPITVAKRWVFG